MVNSFKSHRNHGSAILRISLLLILGLIVIPSLRAQVSIVSSGTGSNTVSVGAAYVQNFNALPTNGTNSWTNDSTLPGWYAAQGASYPTNAYTNIVAAFPNPTNTTAGSLYSMPQHFENNTSNSIYRAIGVSPSSGTGPATIGLRLVNNTGATLTGCTVTYEIKWGYTQSDTVDSINAIAGGSGYTSAPTVTISGGASNATATATINSSGNVNGITKASSGSGYTSAPVITFSGGGGSNATASAVMNLKSSSNSVALSYGVFSANAGSLTNSGYSNVVTTVCTNATTSSVPDDWTYVTQALTNLNLAPGQELWLSWKTTKLSGASYTAITALDNVRVYDIAKGNPSIVTQPMPQSVLLGNSTTLSVVASGTSTMTYQWRKNGVNIAGAIGASYSIASAQPSDVGLYDVVVSGSGGSVTSSPVQVQVYSRCPVIGAATNSPATNPVVSYSNNPSFFNMPIPRLTNGTTNYFDMYLPDTNVPSGGRPAVIVIHGGGGNDGDKAETREQLACVEFASHGYVAISINYKASFPTKSSGSWSAAWPQNIKDAKSAVRWLRKNAATYGIDTNRIGAIGFSWGGNEATMLAMTSGDTSLDPTDAEDGLGSNSTKVQCAANFYGAVQIPDYHNMNQFGGNGVPGTNGTMDYAGSPNYYLSASPASRASNSAAPILLSHGDADLEVMPSQNFALKASLLNAGATVQGVMLVPGGIHSYYLYDTGHNTNTNTVTDVRPQTMGFFDKYLYPATSAPQITSLGTASGGRGSANFSYQITANNMPTSYSATGLPSGLSLNSSTGLITGTLSSSAGTSTITLLATGPSGTAVSTLTLTTTETITIAASVSASNAPTTPDLLGYNMGHWTTSGNAPDWWRYSGVKGARVFISASELQTSTSPGQKLVTNLATFNSTTASARSNGANNSTYIKWSDYSYNYSSTRGNNDINFKSAFTAFAGLGVDTLANITCSPGTFPLASTTDYAGWWEIWQHYYAEAFLLARDYGIHRFSMFNEPNNWSPAITEVDWLLRQRICSDAIQAAISDVNTKYGKSLTAQIYAPNTASGKEKYNTSPDTWGYDAVVNRHLKLDGTTNPAWLNFNFYNYQKYSMLTDDGSGLTGYITDITALRSYISANMGSESNFPVVLTEFNSRTGDSYDGRTENLDTPSDYVALAANCIALSQNKANQLFLFKFGQTAASGTNAYGVAKNGTHYVDNSSNDNNYGGATKAAEVYRLFNKAAQGGRPSYGISVTSGLKTSTTAGVWSLATKDTNAGMGYIFMANKNSSPVGVQADLSSWGLSDGTPAWVEEVSSLSSGGITQIANLQAGQIAAGNIPAQGVWLISFPLQAAGVTVANASEDAQLYDGSGQTTSGGSISSMVVRSAGTSNGRTVSLVKIPVSGASSLQGALLNLCIAATSAGSNPIVAHVYGVKNDSWAETNATWKTLSNILVSSTSDGNQIGNNAVINTGTNPNAVMLGEIVASSTSPDEKYLDVGDFVKTRTNGYASFLVVQDYRWDYSADPLTNRTTGDTQSAGLSITSRESSGAGARLLFVKGGSNSLPPVLLDRPVGQTLNYGDSLTLSAGILGNQPVTYQWKKDGVIVSGAVGPTLTISPVTSANNGSYTVEVTGTGGTAVSSSAQLTVNDRPVIVSAPQSLIVEVGNSTTFSVATIGYQPLSYQWSSNSVLIAGATNSAYTLTTSNTNQSTSYSVLVSNVFGTTNATASLTVTVPSTNYISINSSNFSYTNNFDVLEKSGTSYSVTGSSYSAWPLTNGSAATMLGWYVQTDGSFTPFEGYRTLNNGSSNINVPPSAAQTGLLSMGSASSSTERSFGGLPWTNNNVYMGLRLRNNTGSTIDQCSVAYLIEQYSKTDTTNTTLITVATRKGIYSSLTDGVWTDKASNTPPVQGTTYALIDGSKSTNSISKTNVLTGLALAPGEDLWIRWTVSTTSDKPLALAIDNLSITGFVSKLSQSITFTALNPSILPYGSTAPALVATASSGLPVTVSSSDSNVVTVGPNNVLTIIGCGSATLTAAQDGSSSYLAATPVTQTLTIAMGSPALTWVTPATITYGTPLSGAQNNAGSGGVPGVFTYNPVNGTLLNAGSNTLVATFTPSDTNNYISGLAITNQLVVNKATPVINFWNTNQSYNGSPRTVTLTVSPTNLATGLTYSGSSNAPSAVGNYTVVATISEANYSGSGSATLVIYDPVSLWRSNYFGTSSNSGSAADGADPNGNGLSNIQDYTLGIDPVSPTTNNPISITTTKDNTGSNDVVTVTFLARKAGTDSWYSGLARHYSLEGTTNLTNSSWSNFPGYSDIIGTNQTSVFSATNSGLQKWFFRLKAWLQ